MGGGPGRLAAPGGAPAFGGGRGGAIWARGGDLGGGSFGTEGGQAQLGAEAAGERAEGGGQERREIEGFAGIKAGEDAVGAQGGVVAVFRVRLVGEDHQREQLEDDDAEQVRGPV